MGVPRENMVIGEIGRVVELSPEQIALGGTVPSGSVMVDGLGVGDVGSIVLRDRKHLAQDGLIIVVVAMDSPPAKWCPVRILYPAALSMCGRPRI